jgi:hypothetical protein
MRDLLIAVAVFVGALLAIAIVGTMLWHPERNIDRTHFAHWLKSLFRNYANGATVSIRHRGSPTTLTVVHSPLEDGKCNLAIHVRNAALSELPRQDLRKACLVDDAVSIIEDPDSVVSISVHIPDIWVPSAANVASQAVNRLLDVLGLGPSERFDLTFSGERSLKLVAGIRRRQKAGLLSEW